MPPDRMYPPGVVAVFFAVQGIIALVLMLLILLGAHQCVPSARVIFDPELACPTREVEIAWVVPDPAGTGMAVLNGVLVPVTVNAMRPIHSGECLTMNDWEQVGQSRLANRCAGDLFWIGPLDRSGAAGWTEEDCI